MSQASALKLLEKKKKWMTTKEVSNALKLSQSNTIRTLLTLFKFHEIERDIRGTKYYWKCKP